MKIEKLLVLDDDGISNFLTDEILREYSGLKHYSIFDNGYDVLEYLEKCPADDFPDLILADLKMPEMDGFEFLKTYEQKFRNKDTFIVILSNSSLEKDKNKLSDFTMVKEFMRKPLNEDSLAALIHRLENNIIQNRPL